MKLKYIIGVLALLLLMSNIVSASTVVPITFYKADIGDTAPPNTAITAIYDGNKVIVNATPTNGATNLPTNFDIQGIYLRVDNVAGTTARNDDPNAVKKDVQEVWAYTGSDMPDVGENWFGFLPPVSIWEGDTNIKSGGPIVITYPTGTNIESILANINGNSIVLKVSWGENPDYSNWIGGSSNIHEFPTIALPVAAILGLMFILGRRKE